MSQIRGTIRNPGHVVGGEVLLRIANAGVAVLIGRVYGIRALGESGAIRVFPESTRSSGGRGAS